VSNELALIKALGGGYHAASGSDDASGKPSSTSSSTMPGDDAHERH
jgi:outer membrane protein, multidrug efflux system